MTPLWLVIAVSMLPVSPTTVRPVIDRAIARLEIAGENYTKHRNCFSCHHQALPMMALIAAWERGFQVDVDRFAFQVTFSTASFRPKINDIRQGKGLPGGNTMAAYGLRTLQIAGSPERETRLALIEYLLERQREDGSWPAIMPRPPTEGSRFTNTALTLEAFREERALITDATLIERIGNAAERGRAFLLKASPETMEDQVFQLRGLVAAGNANDAVRKLLDTLLAQQRADGGWSQLVNLQSDAYATGSALVALRLAGLKERHPAFQRGLKYLLNTQDKTGVWLVQTRSRPVQTFFDNGDPGGKSQFITIHATGWALLALLELFPRVRS